MFLIFIPSTKTERNVSVLNVMRGCFPQGKAKSPANFLSLIKDLPQAGNC